MWSPSRRAVHRPASGSIALIDAAPPPPAPRAPRFAVVSILPETAARRSPAPSTRELRSNEAPHPASPRAIRRRRVTARGPSPSRASRPFPGRRTRSGWGSGSVPTAFDLSDLTAYPSKDMSRWTASYGPRRRPSRLRSRATRTATAGLRMGRPKGKRGPHPQWGRTLPVRCGDFRAPGTGSRWPGRGGDADSPGDRVILQGNPWSVPPEESGKSPVGASVVVVPPFLSCHRWGGTTPATGSRGRPP
jgi:hypothetical protein